MKYPKINSLWKRNGWYYDEEKKKDIKHQEGRQDFIEGDYACEEFALIKKWQVQEKIDGTNIRINAKTRPFGAASSGYVMDVSIHGRNEDSQIPRNIVEVCEKIFTQAKIIECQDRYYDEKSCNIWFFGEGYGPRIQKGGGNYRSDVGFILFDVCANGVWLTRDKVSFIAEKLGIPTPPIIGYMTEEEVVAYVKSNPKSLCSEREQIMEGVICRTEPLLLCRNREPLMMKLKCKDFV